MQSIAKLCDNTSLFLEFILSCNNKCKLKKLKTKIVLIIKHNLDWKTTCDMA